jgi:hypothetical protein
VFLAASTVVGSGRVRPKSDDVTANPAPLVFSTYIGGSSTDVASAAAVDAGGNSYITGRTASTDLPVRNAFQSHSGGGVDAFVAKFDPTGALVYCTYLGGAGDDRAFGIAVDAAGAVYLTGWTSSTDFPTAGNPYQPSLAGGLDAFVAKLSATGESLIFSTFLGGASSDQGRAIALDASGHAFIAGQTASPDFPTLHPLQTGLKGPQDAFVAEVDGYGALLFSTYLGGSGTDTAAAIAVGGDGSIYLTGSTDSLDFPTLNAIQPLNAGYQDAFVTKLSPNGAAIVFSTYLGGSGGSVDYPESGMAIDVDAGGNAYVAGVTSSPDFPTRNAFQPALAGWLNAFVAEVNAAGTALDFSTYLGGSNLDYGVALRVDSFGETCVAGYSTSPDFPLFNPVQSGSAGSYDAFLSCLTASGEALIFSTLLGGSNADAAYGLAMDAGSVYIAGLTASSDFPLKNAFQSLNASGKISAFVARLTRYQAASPPAPVPTFPGNGAVNVSLSPALTWNVSSEAASYAVNFGSSPSPPLLANTTNLAYSPGTLAAGTMYYWQVTGANSAGSNSSAVFWFTTACTYGISPAGAAPSPGASSGSVAVGAPAGCAWTAWSSDTSWLTIASGSSGSGSGTANYAVTANPNGTPRVATLTIAGQSFTVTQAGAACTYALGALSAALDAGAENDSVTVAAPIGCAWTASSSDTSWLTITSGSSGSGSGTVNYAATANSGASPQTGTLTIAGQAFTVTQAGVNPPGCIFYLDSVSAGFPDAGGPGRVGVTLGLFGCSWAVSSDSTWLTITSPSTFTGSGAVLYAVAANTTGVTRTGILTVAGQTFTVTQVAGCSFALDVTSASVPWQGVTATVNLTASNSSCPWTSYSTQIWAQRYPQTGTGSASIQCSVNPSANTGGRTATIYLGGQALYITQDLSAATENERFANLMYFGFLGRLPSASELSAQLAALNSGSISRTDLTVNLFNSDEFNNAARFVAGLYVGILGRDAEYAGWLFQRAALLDGLVDQAQLATNFLTSAEYQMDYGSPTDQQYVLLLYANVLQRAPTGAELAAQLALLASGTSRTQMALNFLNGVEFRANSGPRLTAFLQYACLLQRDSEQWERNYWANLMSATETVEQVFFDFVNSAEMAIHLQ